MVLLICFFVLNSELAHAATYYVGGTGGWTFNTVGWSRGKRFRAGDTLVFNYRQGAHNVVAVTKEVYDKCSTPRRGSKVYRSGKDRVRLAKGQNYFMCNFPGHCGSGVKIAINAA